MDDICRLNRKKVDKNIIQSLVDKAELALLFYQNGEIEKARRKIKEINNLSSEIVSERGIECGDR